MEEVGAFVIKFFSSPPPFSLPPHPCIGDRRYFIFPPFFFPNSRERLPRFSFFPISPFPPPQMPKNEVKPKFPLSQVPSFQRREGRVNVRYVSPPFFCASPARKRGEERRWVDSFDASFSISFSQLIWPGWFWVAHPFSSHYGRGQEEIGESFFPLFFFFLLRWSPVIFFSFLDFFSLFLPGTDERPQAVLFPLPSFLIFPPPPFFHSW